MPSLSPEPSACPLRRGSTARISASRTKADSLAKELSNQLRRKVVAVQKKEFPKLRKEYGKVAGDLLWESDIEVAVGGAGNRYITFTGGVFAANKNKADFQGELSNVLKQYRFKQANYKWYEYDDEYTYYSMSPPSDDELVTF